MYKRQTIHQDNTEQKQTEQEEVSKDKAQVDVNKNVERIIETVSYTHLDVYKRQALPYQRSLPPVSGTFTVSYAGSEV